MRTVTAVLVPVLLRSPIKGQNVLGLSCLHGLLKVRMKILCPGNRKSIPFTLFWNKQGGKHEDVKRLCPSLLALAVSDEFISIFYSNISEYLKKTSKKQADSSGNNDLEDTYKSNLIFMLDKCTRAYIQTDICPTDILQNEVILGSSRNYYKNVSMT